MIVKADTLVFLVLIRTLSLKPSSQKISPGCSFTFNGLKQTLLHLQAGIESKLSNVSHLLVNYRTTKDILLLGNAILSLAKKYFPDQIAHSLPEIAMKDLGLKVRVSIFEEATKQTVKFGHNQALIYSSEDISEDDGSAFREWLNDHPFILSALDSKGLEFDDVVVAFDFGRTVWDVKRQRVESLRMLRELYVAVTRAKRRVVILHQRKDLAMKEFLDSLGCDIEVIEDPSQFQVEFNCETSSDAWYERGLELFDDGHFGLASSCFAAANKWGLSNWSKAKQLLKNGNRPEAASAYRRAARCFFEDDSDHKRTLDVLQELSYCPPWKASDNALFDAALAFVPAHFGRHESVRLSLIRDCWQNIEVRDLSDPEISTLFVSYKDHPNVKSLIETCSEDDRQNISKVLPEPVAAYYASAQNYPLAAELYIQAKKINMAIEFTKSAVKAAKTDDAQVFEITQVWSTHTRLTESMSHESYVTLLLRLYEAPLSVADESGRKCLHAFGRKVIIFAAKRADVDLINLHSFDPIEFRTEVNALLESRLNQCIDIVKWYIEKGDYENANDYAQSHWKKTSDEEFMEIISLDKQIAPGNMVSGEYQHDFQYRKYCHAHSNLLPIPPTPRVEAQETFVQSNLSYLHTQIKI